MFTLTLEWQWPSRYTKLIQLLQYMFSNTFLFLLPNYKMSRDIRFPTMWYVQPSKPQISLRIKAV